MRCGYADEILWTAGDPISRELLGAASVEAAVDILGADRIMHGVRCIEDPHLREYEDCRNILKLNDSQLASIAATSLKASAPAELVGNALRGIEAWLRK